MPRNRRRHPARLPLGTTLLALLSAMALTATLQTAPATAATSTGQEPLIVGGHEASQNYAFIAALHENGSFHCGASLIDPRWVVTAAHCVQGGGAPPDRFTVRVGSNDRTIGGDEARVTRSIVHPDYKGSPPGGDIALLKLDRRVGYQPIPIADSAGGPGTATRILGWGTTCDPGLGSPCPPDSSPTELQELDTKLVADNKCVRFEPATELCTDSDTPNAQACFGDSGGPQITGRPGDWELIGVTSRDGDGKPACSTGTGVWTNVTTYTDWIQHHIQADAH